MTYQGTIRKGVVVLEKGATLPVHMSPDFDEPLDDFAEYMK